MNKEQKELPAPDPYAEAKSNLIYFLGGDWLPDHPRFIAMRERLIHAESDADVNQNFIDAYYSGSELREGFTFRQRLSILRHGTILGITDDSQVTQELRDGSNTVFNQYLDTARNIIFPSVLTPAEIVDPYDYWIKGLQAENEATKALKRHMRPLLRYARVMKIFGSKNTRQLPV